MNQAKKIAIAVFAVTMIALGVAVVYAYTASSSAPTYYGNTSPYVNTGPNSGYGYGQGANNGAYGNNPGYGYGSRGYGMGGGMMGGFGGGMMGGW